jgi:hypothetical protein
MSADGRQKLHELIDALPDDDVQSAREALEQLMQRAAIQLGEDAQARVDRRMLESGLLLSIPSRADMLDPPKIRRERLPGKMASETLLEDRRE